MNKTAHTEKRNHSRKYDNSTGNAAFTLIELIVAVSLASLIILITAMIFKQASKAFSESDARNEVYQNVRAAFGIIKRDISGAVLNAKYELFEGFDNINKDDYLGINAKDKSDILILLAGTSNSKDPPIPIALIVYYLDTNNILNKAEITADSTLNSDIEGFNLDDATGYKLGFNVSTLQFRYRDTDGTWDNTWVSTAKKYLPDAVEIKMTISDMRNRYAGTSTTIISIR